MQLIGISLVGAAQPAHGIVHGLICKWNRGSLPNRYGHKALRVNRDRSSHIPPQSSRGLRYILAVVTEHFWFKFIGTTAFTYLFFVAYIYLLKHPAFPVTFIPEIVVDRYIGFNPFALPLYLSLWVYLSLPVMLITTRRTIIEYGFWIAAMCTVGLTAFYFWPSAIPSAHIDWSRYPGMDFLKCADAAGNACPSLHVATAAFSCFWLNQQLQSHGLGTGTRAFSLLWCLGIVYSTMATKQHVVIDVIAGVALALAFAWACSRVMEWRDRNARNLLWIGQGLVEPE
jgi:membrane-associated phospholipid phosphatase